MPHTMMVIQGRARTGKRDALFALFREHLAPRATREDAQQLVVWAAHDDDDDAFTLVEIYNDPAALERNSQADWFWAYLNRSGPLMDGEPMMTRATPRWAKGTTIEGAPA